MMIKVNGEYLEGQVTPEIVRRAKTFSTLDESGDFSYQFDAPDIAENRRKLGIYDISNLSNLFPEASIESKNIPIHIGNLRIEGIEDGLITLSFFSGNTNWFKSLTGRVYDIDLSQFKIPLVNTSPSATLVDTWDNTEGIIFPLLDRGKLFDWASRRLSTGDFLAMTYLKDIVRGIFTHHGFKVNGELFNDALFNTTIVGSANPFDISFPFNTGMSAYPGKTASQTINTTPAIVTFPITTYPFHNGTWSPWDISVSRYTAQQDVDLSIKIDAKFTAVVTYTFELRINGVEVETITGTDSAVSNGFNESNAIRFDAGDYFEVWGFIDIGSASITSGSLKVDVIRLPYIFPQYLLADMTQAEVISSVFLMLNVISDYDPFTKTVTCNLFRNIDKKESQDLSEYINSYKIDFIDILSDVSQHNYFQYQNSLSSMASDFRDVYELDFGAGDLRVFNEGLTRESSVDSDFTGSFDYYNTKFGANLMAIGTDTYESTGEAINIISVTNSGGDALFTTDEAHGFKQLDYVRLDNMINGVYHGLGYEGLSQVLTVPTDTTFTLQNIPFNSAGTGQVFSVSRNVGRPNDVFIASVIPNYLVSNFSVFNTINYSGTSYNRIAYSYFLKPNAGLAVDEMRETLAFGKPFGFTNITLLEKNYSSSEAMFNNPVKIRALMSLPETVYKDLDFSKPVRLKTKDFDSNFFVELIKGYIGSEFECEVELIKFS